MIDLSKPGGQEPDPQEPDRPETPSFGSPFDYDATAEASLTESTSGTAAVPPSGGNSAGPGWDTYSGVGNGPGWGNAPSYPPPASDPLASASGPIYGTPQPDYGQPSDSTSQPPPSYPPVPTYPAATGYPAGAYGDPNAPFGRDPVTGEPFSDKSKTTAGLLQILLGFISVPGVGRLYIGSIGIGLTQLLVFWLGLITTIVLVGFVIFPVIWIWAFVDGILMLTGSVRDPQGRPLRS
ncbi:TM2 domain-containing protein [Rhodococcus spongiicola]|uniref:TM2 domain-containing protein n=1 Tax=Rhodococcus spongiicola TaxID=2487352 RepID=UPI001F2171D4|nr:TM2 domain-containing protein [Rhodococcus spongiicola]